LYENHIEQAKLQLDRHPVPFPVFRVSDVVKTKTFDDLVLEDFEVVGYMSHPAIKAPMAV
jgi:thymidylate synthase